MFSGVVKIADIDDYITPSQNCIKPIMDKEKEVFDTTKKSKKIRIEGQMTKEEIESNPKILLEPDLIKFKDKGKKTAKVTLNDCLACNGCVTTAETLLIQAQSVDEFLKNSLSCCQDNKISVVCVSPQSVLSLAQYFSLSPEETFKRLCNVLEKCGVNYILNFNTVTYFTLKESYREFKERILNESNKQNYIISSECPGWICYAEKKIGDWVIPFLSNTKSPQQVLGHLTKKILYEKFKKEVYLSCIMPCFDKKLEATRETHKFDSNLEVDTVISTVELLDLFDKMNIDFENQNLSQIEPNNYFPFIQLLNDPSDINSRNDYTIFFSTLENYSSNGYSEFILQQYIDEYLNTPDKDFKIERKLGKNSDYREIFLYLEGNEKPVLSFCLVYGFRNIQNIIRNKNKIKYNYLEVMACPGGCINGGGQMRPRNDKETARDILKKIEENFNTEMKNQNRQEILSKIIKDSNALSQGLNDLHYDLFKNIFYTEFKALEKNSSLLNVKW